MSEANQDPQNKKKELQKIATPQNIEDVIPEDVQPILKKLNTKDRKTLAVSFVSMRSMWSGPTPPPEILAKYNEAVPDGAERILRMAEKQSEHRMECEKKVISTELNQSGRGQNYALIVVLAVLCASFWLINTGHDTAGTVLGSIDLVALATVFIVGKYMQKSDLRNK